MHPTELKTDFDRWLSLSERAAQEEAIACNDAFVARMNAAIKRGREKVSPGTFVDLSPPIGARRIYGDTRMSACGSSAAMCADHGAASGGAETLR